MDCELDFVTWSRDVTATLRSKHDPDMIATILRYRLKDIETARRLLSERSTDELLGILGGLARLSFPSQDSSQAQEHVVDHIIAMTAEKDPMPLTIPTEGHNLEDYGKRISGYIASIPFSHWIQAAMNTSCLTKPILHLVEVFRCIRQIDQSRLSMTADRSIAHIRESASLTDCLSHILNCIGKAIRHQDLCTVLERLTDYEMQLKTCASTSDASYHWTRFPFRKSNSLKLFNNLPASRILVSEQGEIQFQPMHEVHVDRVLIVLGSLDESFHGESVNLLNKGREMVKGGPMAKDKIVKLERWHSHLRPQEIQSVVKFAHGVIIMFEVAKSKSFEMASAIAKAISTIECPKLLMGFSNTMRTPEHIENMEQLAQANRLHCVENFNDSGYSRLYKFCFDNSVVPSDCAFDSRD